VCEENEGERTGALLQHLTDAGCSVYGNDAVAESG
jgi:hypothetical protein